VTDPTMTGSTLGRGATGVQKGRLRFYAKVAGQRAPTFRFRLDGEVSDTEPIPRTVDLDRSPFVDAGGKRATAGTNET